MNIFILSTHPVLAANDLCDKHISKMCLETAQLLSTAVQSHVGECDGLYKSTNVNLYKSTHVNHPCSVWARSSRKNFHWLLLHGDAIGHEYSRRYGRTHKSALVIQHARNFLHLIPEGELTPFALAMPEEYKTSCPVESYRRYYSEDKKHIARWKHSETPMWWPYGE